MGLQMGNKPDLVESQRDLQIVLDLEVEVLFFFYIFDEKKYPEQTLADIFISESFN